MNVLIAQVFNATSIRSEQPQLFTIQGNGEKDHSLKFLQCSLSEVSQNVSKNSTKAFFFFN